MVVQILFLSHRFRFKKKKYKRTQILLIFFFQILDPESGFEMRVFCPQNEAFKKKWVVQLYFSICYSSICCTFYLSISCINNCYVARGRKCYFYRDNWINWLRGTLEKSQSHFRFLVGISRLIALGGATHILVSMPIFAWVLLVYCTTFRLSDFYEHFHRSFIPNWFMFPCTVIWFCQLTPYIWFGVQGALGFITIIYFCTPELEFYDSF